MEALRDAPRWRRYLRFWGPDVGADVDDELRFHLDLCAADLVARGHPPEEARRLARARFGDVARVRGWLRDHDRKRQRREERTESMDALLLDLRYAVRKLRNQPAFTASVVLVLALGIGAATAMFSAVDAALLRPLPFQQDGRLVVLAERINIPMREFGDDRSVTIDDARGMRDVFTHVAAYAPGGLNLGGGDSPVRARVALVTQDLFATLGVRPVAGRGFTLEEGTLEGPKAAILSHGLWQRQFGGDRGVIGRDVRLNEVPHRVVGIMPAGFGFPEETELWLPLPVPASFSIFGAFRGYMPSLIVGRLAPGATREQAAQRVHAAVRAAMPADRELDISADEMVQPFRDVLVGKRRTALLVLMGATALVLLVACANVTNLLLSRAAARRGEMALRAALGAGRMRLVRQLLVESVLLALVGGLLGVAIAYASLGALATLMPVALAGTVPPQVDLRVLGFGTLVALATGIAFGLWPAVGASRANAAETIKAGGAAGVSASREGSRMRRVFVVAEIALALMLAVGAGLMLRSFEALLATDTGVQPEAVATLELTLPGAAYPRPHARRQFYDDVLARLHATPGVQSAAVVNELPLRGTPSISISVDAEGRPPVARENMTIAQLLYTSPEYFRTLGIPMTRGSGFTVPADTTRPEVIINEALAQSVWPDENPIGRRLTGVAEGRPGPTVVGVVGNVRALSLESEERGQMYYSADASPPTNAALLARGTLEPRVLAARLQEAVRAVDPTQAVYNVRPMEDVISGAIAPRRANTVLITLFGVVAVALAAVGVYGVIAYGIARRTREIGIRMALGAQSGDVLRLVLREGLVLGVVGVALGLTGAWALRRVLESLLYGVTPADPVAYGGAAVVLLTIAIVATLLPARQALRVDPARTIRTE